MEVSNSTMRLVIKKSSLSEETIRQLAQDQKKNDCRNINKRKKPSDREEMWGWMLNSDQGQNQEDDQQIPSKPKTLKDPEIDVLFDRVKRRKKVNDTSTTAQKIGLLVEKVMALMEFAAEEDIELNRQNKPAIKKIQMLPLLTDYLSKKPLQQEFLDHGVLNLFKDWLEPLPDQSLPNATLRSSILNILTHVLPVDISSEDRREQLKKSGLGKVIAFLSKSDEELTANRKLAKRLIEDWSRIIYNKGARYSDLKRNKVEDGDVLSTKPSVVKKASVKQFVEADLELEIHSKANNEKSAARPSDYSVSVPEPTPYDFVTNPASNRNILIARARKTGYTEGTHGERRKRIEKNIRRLKSSKKTFVKAEKPAYRFSAL